MEFYVKVKPGSEEFRLEKGSIPLVYLKADAENGRANAELLRRVSEVLSEKPGIVSGHHSSRKKLKASISRSELKDRLGAEPV